MESHSDELDCRVARKTYLITYSRADKGQFTSKQLFANAVVEAFSQGKSKEHVLHWACGKEEHKEEGFHYHMAIKLSGNKVWLSAKRYLLDKYNISVHFSDKEYYNYNSAYRYVKKEDEQVLLSEGHPDLISGKSPKTSKASKAKKEKAKCSRANSTASEEPQPGPSKPQKRRRLSNLDVGEIIIARKIHDDRELYALAKQQKEEGKFDLAAFLFAKSHKQVNEVIKSAWKMEEAQATIERSNKPRLERVKEELKGQCVEGCQGRWFLCAKEVLQKNEVNAYAFADAVRKLLVKGRGKYRNILITGPANCGKTFLLDPLNVVFDTFTNPANTSYAWIGAENAEIIFLNDFRYSYEILAWKDMLLLLEGQALHLAAPKSTYAQDILFDMDTPIFATSKGPIEFIGRYNTTDATENEMMRARWNIFEFTHQIPEKEQKVLPRCKRCFAEMVMLGSDI